MRYVDKIKLLKKQSKIILDMNNINILAIGKKVAISSEPYLF